MPDAGLSTSMHHHPPFFYEVVRLFFHFAQEETKAQRDEGTYGLKATPRKDPFLSKLPFPQGTFWPCLETNLIVTTEWRVLLASSG